MLLTEGQMSDHKGTAFAPDAPPRVRVLIGDRGSDSALRAALAAWRTRT